MMKNNMTEIQYPETTGWEEWMYEYKFGAFYIYPPDGLIEVVDTLREKYDSKSASICQAHISLSEPLVHALTDKEIKELQEALSKVKPFDLSYQRLRGFPPHPGVAYAIEPEDKFVQLRKLIHSTSAFTDSPLTRKDRAPHMTIAEFGLDWPATEKLMKELERKVPTGTFFMQLNRVIRT